MNKLKLLLLVTLIIILNIIIYFRAVSTIEPVETIFAECSRNSGRISAAINLITLLMIGYFGLKKIFNEKSKLFVFRILITLFAVNHLIHFYFVYQNFKTQDFELNILDNLHGFVTFLCLTLLPVLLYAIKRLKIMTYSLILIHLFNVTYFISISFYARYKPEDLAYLHRIGILIMILSLIYILYRVYQERSIKFNVEEKK